MEHAAASAPVGGDGLFRDGLGERRLVRDAGGVGRELLCLRSELAAVPSFEFALRERLGRLSGFRHPYFVPVRAVERLADTRFPLGLLSERYNGIRLSRVLPRAAQRGVRLEIDAALFLARELLAALAAFHRASREVSHGAVALERLLLTANGRVMITEYSLGSALEQLRFPPERYWRDLRIPLPKGAGTPRFDQRLDVAQAGVVVLSLILGRALRDDEYPARVSDLAAAAWACVPDGGFEPLPPTLRAWLVRMLQLDGVRSYGSVDQALTDLDAAVVDAPFVGSADSVDQFLMRYRAQEGVGGPEVSVDLYAPLPGLARPIDVPPDPADATEPTRPPSDEPTATGVVPFGTSAPRADAVAHDSDGLGAFRSEQSDPDLPDDFPTEFPAETPRPTLASAGSRRDEPTLEPPGARSGGPRSAPPSAHASAAPPASPSGGASPLPTGGFTAVAPTLEFDEEAPLPPATLSPPDPEPAAAPRGARRAWAGVGAVAVATALLVFGQRWFSPAVAPSMGTLGITSSPRGAAAFVDGRPVGATPLKVQLPPGYHTLELRHAGESRSFSVSVQAGGHIEHYVELPAEAFAGVETGWLLVRSPLDLQVFEGDRLVGRTGAGQLTLPVGAHVLTFRNDEFGYRSTRSVAIGTGRATTATVDLPNGLVAVHARPWAEVWLDGRRVGTTPVGNLPVRIGSHEVVLRHPQLGERREQVTVLVNGLARLDIDLRKP